VCSHTDVLLPKAATLKFHLKDHASIVGNDAIGLQEIAGVGQSTTVNRDSK
jgi:hypothetical protein